MRKISFLLIAFSFIQSSLCLAKSLSTEEVLALININPKTSTPAHVTKVLGQPADIAEGRKRTKWYYNNEDNNVTISWNNKSDALERFYFKKTGAEKANFDFSVGKKLQSGTTDIYQAIKLLGLPDDMTIKSVTQVVHYEYKNNALRLFFRDRVLVDFTLLSNNN